MALENFRPFDNAEAKFRLWSVKLEDYVFGVYGENSREVLEWAATSDNEITDAEVSQAYGTNADLLDQWDDVDDFNSQLCNVLRATTEGIPFDVVENAPTGSGLEAWRSCIDGLTLELAPESASCARR